MAERICPWTGKPLPEPSTIARTARNDCERHPDAPLVRDCGMCGAPQCCPECCVEAMEEYGRE